MMGIGFPELMIILVIIMIIFGAGKLPEIGSAFGRSIKNFKLSMREADELDKKEDEAPATVDPAPQPQAVAENAESGQAPAGESSPPAPQPSEEK